MSVLICIVFLALLLANSLFCFAVLVVQLVADVTLYFSKKRTKIGFTLDNSARKVMLPFDVFISQDMLPIPGDPTQGTGNYNIEDFADLGMFPPFSE